MDYDRKFCASFLHLLDQHQCLQERVRAILRRVRALLMLSFRIRSHVLVVSCQGRIEQHVLLLQEEPLWCYCLLAGGCAVRAPAYYTARTQDQYLEISSSSSVASCSCVSWSIASAQSMWKSRTRTLAS